MRVGEHDLNVVDNLNRKDYGIQEFIRHENYNRTSYINDIALIKVNATMTFNLKVRPACLHQERREILMNKNFTAIGFGALGYSQESSSVLLKVNLFGVHSSECRGILRTSNSQFCVRGNQTNEGQYGDTCGG